MQNPNQRLTKIYYLVSSRNILDIKYVGKTVMSLNNRLCSHKSGKCGKYLKNWLNRELSENHEIIINLIEEVEEKKWVEKEMFWIAYYKSLGFKLCNLTDGGEGRLGYKHTDEFKRKMSERLKGHKSNSGKKIPKQSAYMKEAHSQGLYKFLHTKENSEKAIINRRNNRLDRDKSATVYLVDETNKVINTFLDVLDASEKTGIMKDMIRHCIQKRRKGKDASCRGFRFSRTLEKDVISKEVSRLGTVNAHKISIKMLYNNGDVKIFDSFKSASEYTKHSKQTIKKSVDTNENIRKQNYKFQLNNN